MNSVKEKIFFKFKFNYLIGLIFFLFFFFLFTSNTFAANRYWVGNSGDTVHSPNSWSTVSGGAPGASIPTTADVAIFNIGNTNNALIDANWSVGHISITADYTGTITTNTGININVSGNFTKSGGTWTSAGSVTFDSNNTTILTCSETLPGTVVLYKGTATVPTQYF